ncbi:MAG: cytochrome c oxidase assembly protein [Propionibacteriaceae bacterium]|nr:cytochrome c oxidase assembly protein [Propionibacteriaceae bacterium]
MSEQTASRSQAARTSTAVVLSIWIALGIAVAGTIAIAAAIPLLPPLPGWPTSDDLTTTVTLVGDVIGRLASGASLGLLAALVAFLPSAEDGQLSPAAQRLTRWLVRSAQVWLAAALLMSFANPSFLSGLPLLASFRPDSWWLFVSSMPTSLAWATSALVALGTVGVGLWARARSAFVLAWLAGAGAAIFVVVTGAVSVGLDHDWATDAAALATLATVILASGAVGALAALTTEPEVGDDAVRRYHRAVLPLLGVAVGGYTVAAWQQLAGVPVTATGYGLPVAAGFVVLGLLVVSWLVRQFAERGPDAGTWRRPAASLARDLVLLIVGTVAITAATYLPPPVYQVPQNIEINYLGYEMPLPDTIERLAGLGRPNLFWVVLAVSAIGLYAWGVVRVLRRGGRWPISRTLPWLAGWLLTIYLATSGLWMYSTAVFSWHMLVHMTVNMMVPVLCVLGAPFSLAEAASRTREPGELPGITQLIDELSANRVVRVLLSPPVLWINYVGSLFVVYFSPLFPVLMRTHWGHQLMLLHFMIAGYAFFALLIGPDRHPWKLPYLVRFALLISIMPFHAIFAVGIMMAKGLIGESFYRSLDIPWVGDLLAVQNIAGQITWFTGEVPAFIAVIVLAAQWFRSDNAEAKAYDARVDSGVADGDDEFAAYNEMLAELARRDQVSDASGPSRGGE